MKYTNGNETDSTTVIYRPMECMNCSDVQRENTQLKELNQKMVEVLKEISTDKDIEWVSVISDRLLKKVDNVIAKAEEGKE